MERRFFSSLAYQCISWTATKEVTENLQEQQIMEMEESYSRLFKLKRNGLRDMAHWQTAQFSDTSAQNSLYTAPVLVHKKRFEKYVKMKLYVWHI